MPFQVQARITNDAVAAAQAAGEDWVENPDMRALATLFPADPLVTSDASSYILFASELDAAFDQGAALPSLDGAVEAVLARLNGAAVLMLDQYLTPARPTGQVQTASGAAAAIALGSYYAYAPRDLSALDSASATTINNAATADAHLEQVLELLANLQGEWVWIDLWRIWEALKRQAGGPQQFVAWLNDKQAKLDFERSANDPAVSGPRARHSVWHPPQNAQDPHGQPLGQPLTPTAAADFIRALVRRWIEEETGQQILVEAAANPKV